MKGDQNHESSQPRILCRSTVFRSRAFRRYSRIVPSYNVKLSDGVYSFDNSKTNYAALKWEAPVEAGKHYLLEFHVTSEKQAELMFDLRGFQDNACNLFNRYAVAPGSEQYRGLLLCARRGENFHSNSSRATA